MDNFNNLEKEVKILKIGQQADLAYKLLWKLKGEIKKDGRLAEKYEDFIIDLEWIAVDILSDTEIKGLLEKNFIRILHWPDFNLEEKFDSYMIGQVFILSRDRRKKEFISALKLNQEKISDQEIEDQSGRKIEPTIADWLKEYDLFVGQDLAEKLKKTEFLYQTKNARHLSAGERQDLIKLVDFYEYLKITSEHPLGLEEKFTIIDEDRILELNHGELVDLGQTAEAKAREEKAKIYIEHLPIRNVLEAGEQKGESHLSIKPLKKEDKKMMPPIELPPAIEIPKLKIEPKLKPMPPMPTKPIISDIKPPQRVLSLTDELGQLSTEEFRKLGAEKIREKMDLLEKESMEKRAEGIAAWKKSPVNLEYLEIGRMSVTSNRPVREVIAGRGPEGLTEEEFKALADLNKSLRF